VIMTSAAWHRRITCRKIGKLKPIRWFCSPPPPTLPPWSGPPRRVMNFVSSRCGRTVAGRRRPGNPPIRRAGQPPRGGRQAARNAGDRKLVDRQRAADETCLTSERLPPPAEAGHDKRKTLREVAEAILLAEE